MPHPDFQLLPMIDNVFRYFYGNRGTLGVACCEEQLKHWRVPRIAEFPTRWGYFRENGFKARTIPIGDLTATTCSF